VSRRVGRCPEQGFALVVVLWSLGFLALITAGLTASSRMQVRLADAVRGAAIAEAAADGAAQRAIFQLHTHAWQADGRTRRISLGQAAVDVTLEDQSARINPNFSPPPLLAALLGLVGANPAQATELARRIADWRTATPFAIGGGPKLDRYRQAGLPYAPPDRPFASVEEIGLVVGMTPALLARLQPYLSVFQAGDPGTGADPGPGRSVLQDAEMINHAAVLVGFSSPYRIIQIRTVAVLRGGTRFTRTIVVRLPVAAPGPDAPAWQILTWE
jgi:general secretion pathway protein K